MTAIERATELYDYIQQVAAQSNRPMKSVLLESLAVLLGEPAEDFESLLARLDDYSDAQLLAIVFQRRSSLELIRLHDLSDVHERNELNDAERQELEQLLEREDEYILLRSKALVLLKERGHDSDAYRQLSAR
jgi:succinate dehydrogenase flavin-adding protein (antitoxin of CptAB toxin-antitoxin module)